LSPFDAFADLPDDARRKFAGAAEVRALVRDEEASGFALALVLSGEVDVASQIADAAADRMKAGSVLRSRGTLDEAMPIRLVCAGASAKLALWSDDDVEAAFRTCPWVEDDLRAASDRLQALVGLTMGALGERLDASLRAQLTSKLTLRVLTAGEVFAEEGKPIKTLLVVGAGELELAKGDAIEGRVMPGEFLFANEVLAAKPAPATARAGSGGALVLVTDRSVAQELLVTVPPLLEIFAGM
jgi:hypothetical protein